MSACLSRIWLNPLRSGTQRLLRNPQAMHAAVMGALPVHPETGRTLWRLESTDPHRAELWALTPAAPSWEHLVEQAGWAGSDEAQVKVRPYKPLLDRVTRGQAYMLRVRANPVSSTKAPTAPSSTQKARLEGKRPRGAVVAHRTAGRQMRWFVEKAPRWGFTVPTNSLGEPEVQLVSRERVAFSKSEKRDQRRRVVLETATFEGRVLVDDPDLARRSLLEGVGRGRAYGCGLITLAPLTAGS